LGFVFVCSLRAVVGTKRTPIDFLMVGECRGESILLAAPGQLIDSTETIKATLSRLLDGLLDTG
jgi:hypothetical protein